MPDEKLEFSAQDLGRFAAYQAHYDRRFVLLDVLNWLQLHATSLTEYARVKALAEEGYFSALDSLEAERLQRACQVAPDGPGGGVSAQPPGSRRESDPARAGSSPSVVGAPSDSHPRRTK